MHACTYAQAESTDILIHTQRHTIYTHIHERERERKLTVIM